MKRITTSLICLLLYFTAYAQNEAKKTIAVVPFSYAKTLGAKAYATSLTESIVNAVVKSNRFQVVDRTNFEDIFSEDNLQKGENFIDGLVVEQGKKLGAEYIIAGNLISAWTEKKYLTQQNGVKEFRGYTGQVSFSIKILDVATGAIKATEIMDNRSDNMLIFAIPYPTEEEAISRAIGNESINKSINSFIDKHFPITVKIFEITEEKKGEAKRLVITGGSAKGINVKQMLKVVEILQVEVDGQTVERQKVLGWLQVESVDDANFSTCKVKDGGDVIKSKFDSKVTMLVLSGQ